MWLTADVESPAEEHSTEGEGDGRGAEAGRGVGHDGTGGPQEVGAADKQKRHVEPVE